MSWLERVQTRVIRSQYARLARKLETADPARMAAAAESRLIRAFHRAAESVPAYQRLLLREGINPRRIATTQDFAVTVPILDKQSIFAANSLRDLCVGGNLDDIGAFYSSSGHSGTFSFGVSTWREPANVALRLEFLLHSLFDVLDRKTLLVNCLPMGVTIPTRTVPVADASVRSDVALALLDKLGGEFEQTILVGESLALKRILDEGVDRGTPWQDLHVHIITGGEFIAESMRAYFGRILGFAPEAPERGMMLINMGLSELGLSLFCETYETAQIRRLASDDPDFLQALGGNPREACPAILQYNPLAVFAESVPDSSGREQLVVTPLGLDQKMPLVRYNTQDEGHLIGYAALQEILERFGHGALRPRFRLPCALVSGKKHRLPMGQDQWLSPHEVKEALYRDHDIAAAVTGDFRITLVGETVQIRVQLRDGRVAPADAPERLTLYLQRFVQASAEIEFRPFHSPDFDLVRDYQTKPRYVSADDRNLAE